MGMTREEAIEELKAILEMQYWNVPWSKAALDMAIKALEQESILDKIRAEIESIEHYSTNNGHEFWLRTPDEIKKDVLTIIDKYKAESEGNNVNRIGN